MTNGMSERVELLIREWTEQLFSDYDVHPDAWMGDPDLSDSYWALADAILSDREGREAEMDVAEYATVVHDSTLQISALRRERDELREALDGLLPIVERERQGLVECCSLLERVGDGVRPIEGTLDPDAADEVARLDEAIARARAARDKARAR